MYKPADKTQTSFLDFDQLMGLNLNTDNRWIQIADRIPWELFKAKYASLFPNDTGNVDLCVWRSVRFSPKADSNFPTGSS